jgi:uncharacterized protein with NRDE domain
MCLVAIAIDQSRQFPLVVAANRDEFFARPTARLGWWRPEGSEVEVLGGRDLQEGGAWLGLSAAGRMALVTNLRGGMPPDPQAPSRGRIVPLWLTTPMPPDKFWMHVALSGYNGFNLIATDFARGECYWASSAQAMPRRLQKGLYGLSNGALDDPWPKVDALKQRTQHALARHDTVDALSGELFAALGDRNIAADGELPHTGVPIELERVLSAAFIRTPDARYGTRCSTLLITERVGRRYTTHVLERSFTPGPGLALLRRSTLRDWPPRYDTTPVVVSSADSPVTESDDPHGETIAAPATRVIKPRARGLLKPAVPRRG